MAGTDPELEAMGAVVSALESLPDKDARSRVLNYAAGRFEVSLSSKSVAAPSTVRAGVGTGDVSSAVFPDFVDLFDAADPKTDVDKTIVAAYWLQVCKSQGSWASQAANDLLKDTGHGVKNITRALDSAQKTSPALVRQMAKAGKSQQARKTYKLTTSGVTAVRDKLGAKGIDAPRDDTADIDE